MEVVKSSKKNNLIIYRTDITRSDPVWQGCPMKITIEENIKPDYQKQLLDFMTQPSLELGAELPMLVIWQCYSLRVV